jgi:hypothetical protein
MLFFNFTSERVRVSEVEQEKKIFNDMADGTKKNREKKIISLRV